MSDQEANVKEIDLAREGTLLPPSDPQACQKCAVRHEEGAPHNQQSLYWQYWFYNRNGRWPTWNDAMEHCSPRVKEATMEVLRQHGIDPAGGS